MKGIYIFIWHVQDETFRTKHLQSYPCNNMLLKIHFPSSILLHKVVSSILGTGRYETHM